MNFWPRLLQAMATENEKIARKSSLPTSPDINRRSCFELLQDDVFSCLSNLVIDVIDII